MIQADPKPKKAKSEKKAAVAYCDYWCRQYIKQRDRRCVTCGARAHRDDHNRWWVQCIGSDKILPLDWSHIYRKSNSHTVRWNERNVHAQGRSCHWKHHQQTDESLRQYATRKYGADAIDELWILSKTTTHLSARSIRAMGDFFRAKCQEREG